MANDKHSPDSQLPALDVSIVIPVFNEHESLQVLHQKICMVMETLGLSWEVIYIDDGSTDGSTAILEELHRSDTHVTVMVQRRNFGKSSALAAGFAYANGKFLITLDADLQDEPSEIPKLIEYLNNNYDVVVGWRQKRIDPLSKRIPSWVANNVTTLFTGLKLKDMNSGLKAYRQSCIKRISLYGDMHRYIPIIAHFAGFRVVEVPVIHHERQFGHSKYGGMRFIRGGLDLVTVLFLNRYGLRPLHLFGFLGGILLGLGLLINLILAVEWFQGLRPIGDRPLLLMGIVLILIGVQILSVGLLAEMLVAFMQKNENPLNTLSKVFRKE
jgi:glycosyltransferase involved in cell wall biosynthesis